MHPYKASTYILTQEPVRSFTTQEKVEYFRCAELPPRLQSFESQAYVVGSKVRKGLECVAN